MPKIIFLSVLLFFSMQIVKGQKPVIAPRDAIAPAPQQADTGEYKYVNPGKVAARKAVLRSAMIPGWGQVGNGLNLYRGIKVAAIYTGGTLLALSYIQNNGNYHQYLEEIQYRTEFGVPKPGNGLEQYGNNAGLITAKEIFRRNREVIVFSFVALYAVNIIEAYVDARLKYFDIGNESALKISPAIINSSTMFGYQTFTPGMKMAIKF